MAIFPEKEANNIIERPDEASQLNIERRDGTTSTVTPVQVKFTAQVNDDNGEPLIQTPQNKKITITIPAVSEEELKINSKGNIENTHTWRASFFLRAILRALHFGKEVLFSPLKEGVKT